MLPYIDTGCPVAGIVWPIMANSFWNVTVGFRRYNFEQFDPHFKDNLYLYGDSTNMANQFGVTIIADGQRTFYDDNGLFFAHGRVNNVYSKNQNDNFTFDASFTSQIDNHLLEIGGGGTYSIIRYYEQNRIWRI